MLRAARSFHTQEVTGSSPVVSTIIRVDSDRIDSDFFILEKSFLIHTQNANVPREVKNLLPARFYLVENHVGWEPIPSELLGQQRDRSGERKL